MDVHMYFKVLARLLVLHCVGSITCEYRRVHRLRPEIHQPFDYRCPCVPLDSCSHPPPRDLSPCPDDKTVRCCTNSGSRDARVYLGIEPLTTAIMKDNEGDDKNATAQMKMEEPDGDLEEEMKVDFNIDEYNNREMKSINITNINNINTVQDKKMESNIYKTNLEENPESITKADTFFDNSMIDVDEMVKNSSNMDSMINLNIQMLYENNNDSAMNEGPELIEVEMNITNTKNNISVNVEDKMKTDSLRVTNYQIVFPDDPRIRDESSRKIIVYPVNTTEIDDLTSTLEEIFKNTTKNYNSSDKLNIDSLLNMDDEINTGGELKIEDDDEQEVLNEETGIRAEEESENDDEDIYSSTEILEQIKDFGKRMSLRDSSQAHEKGSMEEKNNDNIIKEEADRRDFKVTKETMESPKGKLIEEEEEMLPAASETVETIVMPNGLQEDGNKVPDRVPIRLPPRNLKLQIQGTSRPKVRNAQQKRKNPFLNSNSNIRDIINDQKYGTKVETPKTVKHNARSKHRLPETTSGVAPSQSVYSNTGLNDEYLSETNQRGVFVPPSYLESGFLPMVEDEPDLKIVGPIPLGFQDRSKPNNFQTEDGIRISDLELPSGMKPPLFFNVFDQGKSNSINEAVVGTTTSDDSHPELPEQDAKDFLSNPNNEILNKSLYETTEDGVYIVQLPLPPVGEVEPFRSEDVEEEEETEEDDETSEPLQTGPVDHHNLDVELESKEDQITQFQLAQTNNRFNLKAFPQNPERFIENINFQFQPPLSDQQNFRRDLELNTETRPNGFRKEKLNNIPFLTSLELPSQEGPKSLGFQRGQNFEPFTSVDGNINQFQQSDATQESKKFRLPLGNNEANFRFTAPKLDNEQNFVLQNVPQNQHTLALFVKSPGTSGNSPKDFSATQQLPSNRPFSFTSSLISGQNDDITIPLTQQLPSNRPTSFASGLTNNQNTDVTLPLTQQLPSNKPLTFASTFINSQNNDETLPQTQQLPSTSSVSFLPTPNIGASSEQFNTDNQLLQRQRLDVDNRFTSQQLPQNGPVEFTEATNKDRFVPRLSFVQELPQSEVTSFASQLPLLKVDSVLKPTLPNEQETVFKTKNQQNVFSQGLPESPASPNFLQIRRPEPPPSSAARINTLDLQKRPNIFSTQNQPQRETSSQVSLNSDNEKSKYDIALERYKADLKIYREQYEAFLKKNFPSAIRIF